MYFFKMPNFYIFILFGTRFYALTSREHIGPKRNGRDFWSGERCKAAQSGIPL